MDGEGPCSLEEDAVSEEMIVLAAKVEALIRCYEENPPEPEVLPMALPPSIEPPKDEPAYNRAFVMTKLRLLCGSLNECRTILKAPKI